MKLVHRILLPLSIAFVVILTVWAVIFYFEMIYEVNDETDDALEHYSELLIKDKLAGDTLTYTKEGSNNTFFFEKISSAAASVQPHIMTYDTNIFIESQNEFEPARLYKTVFKDADGQYYQLTVSMPILEKSDLKESILFWIIFLFFALLLFIIIINIIIYHKNLKPFFQTLAWLSEYKIGKENVPLPDQTDIKEFKILNAEILKYVKRTEEAFEEQKLFIGKVSHELQTPIAICQNRLDLLMDDSDLSENQIAEIIKTQQTLTYMSKLNKSLLFLTKIYNHQFPDITLINFNTLIHNILPDFEMAFAHTGIHLTIEEEGVFAMEMNEILATSLISNLLKNAYTHNVRDGEIQIRLSVDGFSISNSGVFEALDEGEIYKPFYYVGNKEKSSGLGLTIVLAIGKLYGIEIRYRYSGGMHCFWWGIA